MAKKEWRKMAIIGLSCCIFLSLFFGVTVSAEKDGIVSTNDVRTLLQVAAGEITLTARQQALGDYDRDGNCNSNDARLGLMYTVGSAAPLQSVNFHSYYTDVGCTVSKAIPDDSVFVVTSKEEWDAFTTADETVDPRVFYEKKEYTDTFFEAQTLIVIPYCDADMYIAAVAADENTVYISTVTIADADALARTAYAFAIVDKSAVENRTIDIMNYTEESSNVLTTLTQAKAIFKSDYILDQQNNTGKYDYNNPIVLESVADCEIFVEEHTDWGLGYLIESYFCTLKDFEEYDEEFFKSNLLMLYPVYDWFDYPDPVRNQFVKTVVYDDHMITTFHYTVLDGAYSFGRMELNMYCIPIRREYYSGQEMSVVFYGDVEETK